MSPEIILLAIGCYLFCGVEEKIYRIKTGDWVEAGYYTNLEKDISEFSFIPKQTTYEEVIEKFGKNYTAQRTHKVIRKQKYNEEIYYFNKELRYVYRQVYSVKNRVLQVSCSSDLELTLLFKDNLLAFYHVYDSRIHENNCGEYLGKLNSIKDKNWLPGGDNYASGFNNCNKKFYRIFTLGHFEEWDKAWDCDFKKDFKNYWADPVYSDRQYVTKDTGWPCGGIFNSC
jgi:hypothetical protein